LGWLEEWWLGTLGVVRVSLNDLHLELLEILHLLQFLLGEVDIEVLHLYHQLLDHRILHHESLSPVLLLLPVLRRYVFKVLSIGSDCSSSIGWLQSGTSRWLLGLFGEFFLEVCQFAIENQHFFIGSFPLLYNLLPGLLEFAEFIDLPL
jgi:hypothetical protein